MSRPVSDKRPAAERIIAPALALFSLLMSILAMPQDLVWGDAPELSAAAWILGVPHPTGYPLYLLSTRLFMCLPLGTVVFRAHLLAALMTAVACVLLYRFLRETLRQTFGEGSILSAFPALLAVITFRTVPIVWEQEHSTEVYPLFLLLFSLTLWLLEKVIRQSDLYLPAFFFISGLHLIHHRLGAFLVAASLGVISLTCVFPQTDSSVQRFRKIVQSSVWLLPPLLLLLYFPLRAAQNPAVNWFDPDHPARLYALLSGGQYSQTLSQGIQSLIQYFNPAFVLYCLALPFLCYSLLGILALVGLAIAIRKTPWLGFFVLGLVVIYQDFMMVYRVGDWSTFLLPSLILLTVPLAYGYASLLNQIEFEKWSKAGISLLLLGFTLIAALPLTINPDVTMTGTDLADFAPRPIKAVAERFALLHYTAPTDYASQVWHSVPNGTPVITGLMELSADNEYYPLIYQQAVERRNPNSPVIGTGFLLYDWYREQVNRQTSLHLQSRDDQPLASREAWLEDTWQTVVAPLIEPGPVIATSNPLPPHWTSRATIQNVSKIQIDQSPVPLSYRIYVPKGYVLKVEKHQ